MSCLCCAALSWKVDDDPSWSTLLDTHVWLDSTGGLGEVALALGDVYRLTGTSPLNGSALFFLLHS